MRSLLLAVGLFLTMTTAHAGFDIIPANPEQREVHAAPVAWRLPDTPRFSFVRIGWPDADYTTIKAANKQPVAEALKHLCPPGWTVLVHDKIRDYAVTWPAGDDWERTLYGIAAEFQIDMVVDHDTRQLDIGPHAVSAVE